jgi:hypothetical protein
VLAHDVGLRADAESQVEPSAGEVVDGDRTLRQPHGMVRGRVEGVRHRGPEPHAPRGRGE